MFSSDSDAPRPSAMDQGSLREGGLSLTRRTLIRGSLASAAAATAFTLRSTTASAAELEKASVVQEAFDEPASAARWAFDWHWPITFDGRMVMSASSLLWSTSNYDFSDDEISAELVSAEHTRWGLVGGQGYAGGYYYCLVDGQLWCVAIGAQDNGHDAGFVSVPYDAKLHRFLFITQRSSSVIFSTAPSYAGQRTVLRQANLADIGTSNLRMEFRNLGASEAVWDNLNCYSVESLSATKGVLVDFADVTGRTAPDRLGFVVTGLGRVANRDAAQAAAERALDARRIRLLVAWDGSRTVNTAAGSWHRPAKPLIDLYRSWGYTCVVSICGRDGDFDGYVAGDAASIVAELGTESIQYAGPNEFDQHDVGVDSLIDRMVTMHEEVQAVAPGTTLWGPDLSHFDRDVIMNQYSARMSPSVQRGISYHSYPMWSQAVPTDSLLAATSGYGDDVSQSMVDLTARGVAEDVMVSELNLSALPVDGYAGAEAFDVAVLGQKIDGRLFSSTQTVWMASAVGHVLRAGGVALTYANQSKALSVFVHNEAEGDTTNVPWLDGQRRADSSPMPAYWALAMWTGAGTPDLDAEPGQQPRLFAHFKDTFYNCRVSGVPGVEAFAVNNEAGGHNIVLINKSNADVPNLEVQLKGVGGMKYDMWQTSPGQSPAAFDEPTRLVNGEPVHEAVEVTLAAGSVTTVVLSPQE